MSTLQKIAILGTTILATVLVIWVIQRIIARFNPKPVVPPGPAGFMHLKPGHRYVVRQAFTDFDGSIHPVGETWTFHGYNFLPYDDGLTLIVEPGSVRLQWRPEAQGEIINDLEHYIVEADEPPAADPAG